MELTALNCNGNPLDPNPARGRKHSADILRSIEVAAALGVRRVVTMSGTAGHGGRCDEAGLERPPVGQRLPRRP